MKKLPTLLNSPARVVVTVGLIILVSEYLIMLLTGIVPPSILPDGEWLFIDPILLTTIVSPILYFLIYQPLCRQALVEKQFDELQRFQEVVVGRELRMKKLVEENAILRRASLRRRNRRSHGQLHGGAVASRYVRTPCRNRGAEG